MDQVRWIDVDPHRLRGWVERFGARHGGEPSVGAVGGLVSLTAPDGTLAECHPPPGLGRGPFNDVAELANAACAPREIGLILIRRGGFAVGVAEGARLAASKVDSRYVQARTAAGGWSQQRFARRRENQAKAAAGEAADVCARLLLPVAGRLAAVVTGGDRPTLDTVLRDQRLAPLRPLVAERTLAVGDPKLTVLRDAVAAARAVRIRLVPAR